MSNAIDRAGVTVTFLRMDAPPDAAVPPLPQGVQVVRLAQPTVAYYRFLYATVGGPYLWWLRRLTPDGELARLLASPAISIMVLYAGGEPGGFYELDARSWPDVNLSYFGLMPHCIGHHLGYAFLRHAVDLTWQHKAGGMTVNTCTADHPRALPTYRRAGFRPVRQVREVWDIPRHLGMTVPPALRLP